MNEQKLVALMLGTLCVILLACERESSIVERECWTTLLLETNARCGLMTVPSDPEDTTGVPRQIAFAVRPPALADADVANPPVMFLIGGPGLSGTYFSEIEGYEPDALDFLNDDRELILVDYRGVGQSEPELDCEITETLEECRTVLHESGMAPELRAATFARDLDLLLGALGYDAVVLYGESWGARLALTMMRDVPDRISHVVLDGVFPPEKGLRDDPEAALAGLDYVASVCEDDPECHTTLGDIRRKIMQLGERWVDRDDAGELFGGIAAVSHFPAAPLLVHELWSREPSEAAEIALQIYEWTHEEFDASAIDRAEAFLLPMGVVCAEEANLLDQHGPLDVSRYGISGPTLEIILGHLYGAPMSAERALAMCDKLELNEAAPEQEVMPVLSDIPTLVLSGGMDMDTSFAWGSLAASRLAHSQHHVFPFSGHVTALRDDDCPRSLVAQFIRDPGRDLDTSCLADLMAVSGELVLSSPDILAEIEQHIPDTMWTK